MPCIASALTRILCTVENAPNVRQWESIIPFTNTLSCGNGGVIRAFPKSRVANQRGQMDAEIAEKRGSVRRFALIFTALWPPDAEPRNPG